ncbi:MAG: hypothetical protein KIT48_04630 [Pseudolabrys sp.]|nr:hypothetical protein [Pseudolabrys sp.]
MIQDDYGYSDIKWEDMNEANVRLVEAEYRQRLEGTIKGSDEIDKKAQYILTGLIGLVTALIGLSFTQAERVEIQYLVGLYALATVFILGAICSAISLRPRMFVHPGSTPQDLNVAKWQELLRGDEKTAIRLAGVRIKEYARGIARNEQSNAQKSWWLQAAIILTAAAAPTSLLTTVAAVLALAECA